MDKTIQTSGENRDSENQELPSMALFEETRQHAGELERKTKRLQVLNSLNTQISLVLTPRDVLQLALIQGLQAIGTADGSIMLLDPMTGDLEIQAWLVEGKFIAEKSHRKLHLGEGIAGYVAETGLPYNCPDTAQDKRIVESFSGRQFGSLLCVPILSNGGVIGTISADSPHRDFFQEDDVQFLSGLGGQIAAAIEMQRLREIGAALATLSLDEILDKVVEAAALLTGAEFCTMFLLDEKTGDLIRARNFPPSRKTSKGPRSEGLSTEVMRSGKAIIIQDAQTDTRVKPESKEQSIQAILGVPLQARADHQGASDIKTIGVLFVNTKRKREFGRRHVEILESLANQAALAIENAKLFEERKRAHEVASTRAKALSRLNEVGNALTSTLKLDTLLDMIVRYGAELLNAEMVSVFLVRREGFLSLEAEFGNSGHTFPRGLELEIKSGVKTGLTGHVAKVGELVNLHGQELSSHPAVKNPSPHNHLPSSHCASFLAIPLKRRSNHKQEVIGLIKAENKKDALGKIDPVLPFDEEDILVLRTLASYAETALENARLFEKAERERSLSENRAEQLLALQDVTREMLSEFDLQRLLALISKKAAELLGADAGGILLYDDEKKHLTFSSAYGLSEKMMQGTCDAVGTSIAGRVVLNGKPILANNIPEDPRFYNPAAEGEGILAIASTPLLMDGQVIGTLDIHSKSKRRAFDEGHLQILSLMANQAAIAIENARLFDETRRRTITFQTLHQTGLELTRYKPVPQLVKTILRRAVELLHAKGGGLNLLEKSRDRYKLAAVWDLPEDLVGRSWDLSEGIVGEVIRLQEPKFVPDYPNWEKRLTLYDGYPIEGVVSAPIAWQDNMWGAIAIYTNDPKRAFDQEDMTLLGHLGNLAALALENARGTDELNQVMSSTVDAIIAVDGEGRITRFNDRAEKILGYRAAEILGRNVRELYYEPDEPQHVQKMLEDSGGKLSEYDTYVKGKTGERIPIRLSASLLFDYDGKFTGSVGFFRDLRELDSAHREIDRLKRLLQAGRAITELHDLPKVLDTIVDMTFEALHADTVSLFRYDRIKDEIHPIPIQRGLRHESAASLDVGPDSIVRKMIKDSAVHFAEDAPADALLGGEFIQREGIRSSAAIPLKVGDAVVGVLFCNYRRPHSFTDQEQTVIPLFANQAAIAIENARLYEESQHRAKQFETLYQVGLDLTTELAREAVLQNVVEHALALTNAKYGALSILSPDKKVELFMTSGEGPLRQEGFEGPPQGLGVLGDLLQEAQLIRLANIREHPNFRDFPLHHPIITSFLGISVISKGRIVGSLYVGNKKGASGFSLEDGKAIALLAAQVAVAVENMRLFESEQQRIRRLEAIRSVSRAANSTLELKEIYQKSIAEMMQVFDLDQGGVVIFNYQQGYAYTEAEYPQMREPNIQIPIVDNPAIEWILREQAPLPIQDAANDPRLYLIQDAIRQWGVKTTILIPLIVKGKVIGTLGLDAVREHREFTRDELDLAQTLANSVAIAISNAQAYRELDQRELHLQAVYETGLATLGTLDRKEMIEKILRQAAERVCHVNGENASFAMMQEYDSNAHDLVFTTAYPPEILPKLSVEIGERLAIEKNTGRKPSGITARAARERSALLVEDVQVEPDYISYNPETRSELAVPILDGDRLLGVLNVEHNKPYAFDEHDKRAFTQLTGLIAVAMKNQEQADKLRRQAELIGISLWEAELSHEIEKGVGDIRGAVFDAKKLKPSTEVLQCLDTIDHYSERLRLPPLPLIPAQPGIPLKIDDPPRLDTILQEELEIYPANWRAVTFVPDLNCPDVRVAIHPTWLRRVVRHLVRNAAQNMPMRKDSRQIIVRTQVQGNLAEIQVQDTGDGVNPELIDKIFNEPISRRIRSESGLLLRHHRPPGRGLLLTRHIAEYHGGKAWLKSNEMGKGACFAVRLPISRDGEMK